jgi:hypothetical protein
MASSGSCARAAGVVQWLSSGSCAQAAAVAGVQHRLSW